MGAPSHTVLKGAEREHVMPPSQDPLYAGLGQAVRIGTELLAALIVGGALGWVVDTYLLDSNPWGMVMGLALGAAAGVRSAYRSAQRWQS
jgi:ATP synthase protein I